MLEKSQGTPFVRGINFTCGGLPLASLKFNPTLNEGRVALVILLFFPTFLLSVA